MRLFTAIEFDDLIKSQLLDLRDNLHGLKWVRENQLHLTLRFIGNVDDGQAAILNQQFQKIQDSSLRLKIQGVGVFPDTSRARILWAGIVAERNLFALQEKIEEAIVKSGLEPETRAYHPHITLARIKYVDREILKNYLEKHREWSLETVYINSFHLVESTLNRDGSIYHNIGTYQLAEGRL